MTTCPDCAQPAHYRVYRHGAAHTVGFLVCQRCGYAGMVRVQSGRVEKLTTRRGKGCLNVLSTEARNND